MPTLLAIEYKYEDSETLSLGNMMTEYIVEPTEAVERYHRAVTQMTIAFPDDTPSFTEEDQTDFFRQTVFVFPDNSTVSVELLP